MQIFKMNQLNTELSKLHTAHAIFKMTSTYAYVRFNFKYSTVVILINATLMHKSTLNTNNFRNSHFGQKYQKQNILKIFRRL